MAEDWGAGNDRPGLLARAGNDRSRVARATGIQPGSAVYPHRPRSAVEVLIIPVVVLQFAVAAVFGAAIPNLGAVAEGAWFPAVTFWIFLIVLHRQLLLLRLPAHTRQVEKSYVDALAKRRGYGVVLLLTLVLFLALAVPLDWKLSVSSLASLFGIAAVLDCIGRDRSTFVEAVAFASRRRVEAYDHLAPDDRAVIDKAPNRVGVPHVHGLFGPALCAAISAGFAVLVALAVHVAGPGEPGDTSSSGATIASLVLAVIAGIVLVVFWAAPSVMIGFTKWADRHHGAVAATWRRRKGRSSR